MEISIDAILGALERDIPLHDFIVCRDLITGKYGVSELEEIEGLAVSRSESTHVADPGVNGNCSGIVQIACSC